MMVLGWEVVSYERGTPVRQHAHTLAPPRGSAPASFGFMVHVEGVQRFAPEREARFGLRREQRLRKHPMEYRDAIRQHVPRIVGA